MNSNILNVADMAGSICIAGHIRPDGDCTGACMALYNYFLEKWPDKRIDVYMESVPEDFRFLKNTDRVRTTTAGDKEYELFVALDCGSIDRLGDAERFFRRAPKTISIDHHISNTKFAQENHVVPDASSTSEVLFELIGEENISKDVAEALYLGIVHDTGVFKHSCTSRRTMEIAGLLMEKGLDYSKIIDESFFQRTYVQNQVLGRCLLESFLLMEGQIIVSYIDLKTMAFYGADSHSLDGVIDQLRVTKGVEVAILLHETRPQEYKVSMRSNGKVDVSAIASYFGGGGHVRAAGCSMKGSVHDAVNNLTMHIEEQLNNISEME